MHEYVKERLRKISDGLSCRSCPMRQCVGRCVLLKAADLISEMERDVLVRESEAVRLRRMIESEVEGR